MKKQLNPLQPLINEMHKNKKLHSQLAENAEREHNRYNDNYVHFERGVAYGFKQAIQMLGEFNFLNDACANPPKFDGWISVKDKLPSDNEFVLVYAYGQIKVYFYAVSDDGQERCHWWEDEGGAFHSDITDGDVTHWMPLPKPPKEIK